MSFNDVFEDHWAYPYINYMASVTTLNNTPIIQGVGGGNFSPNSNTTVAQFCKMAILAADIDGEQYDNWSESNPLGWSKNYMDFAIDNDFVVLELASGQTNYSYYQNTFITREHAFDITWRAFNHNGCRRLNNIMRDHPHPQPDSIDRFKDVESITPKYLNSFSELVKYRVVAGFTEVELGPDKNITRAQICTILYRILEVSDRYIVTGDVINARPDASTNNKEIGILFAGDIITVNSSREISYNSTENRTWVSVYFSSGTAWVAAEYIRPEKIKNPSPQQTQPGGGDGVVYANNSYNDTNWLSDKQVESNAEYIYRFLRVEEGWSKIAIIGLLGNINYESHFNPGVWQYDQNGPKVNEGGYGIVQWTPFTKFLYWAKLDNAAANVMATNNPKELMDLQLRFLVASCQPGGGEWITAGLTTNKNLHSPGDPDYITYTPVIMSYQSYINRETGSITPENMAYVFHAHYERSHDTLKTIEDYRAVPARKWYNYFVNWQ